MPMDVTMPDGTTISGVPDGTTKADLQTKYAAHIGGQAPNTAVDVMRSIPGGLAKGAASMVGWPGDIHNAINSGIDMASNAVRSRIGMEPVKPQPASAFSSGSIGNAMATPFGGFYKPQTTPGQYAETISSFAPAALSPGNALQRTMNVVIPGASSETAGQIFKDTPFEGIARAAGGIGGTLLSSGLGSAMTPRTSEQSAQMGRDYVKHTFDSSGQSLDDLEQVANASNGKPITAAEVMGPQAQTNLMALARRPGETGDALQAQLRQRAMDRPDRVFDDMALASGIHPEAAKGNIQDIVASGQEQARPLYEEAFRRPGSATWSERLQEFLDAPELRSGIARGLKLQRQRALADGVPFNPSDYDVSIDAQTGEPMFSWSGKGDKAVPNLRTLDAGKRGLDAMLEDYRGPNGFLNTRNPEVKNLIDIRKAYTSAVDQVAPPVYRQARAVAGDYLSAESAFNMGQKAIFARNMTEADFERAVGRMTPSEQGALKGGVANRLFEMSQNGSMRPAQFLTPRVREKLEIALGPNQAELFTKNLEREAGMRAFEQRAIPSAGSQTQPLAQAMKDQDNFGQGEFSRAAESALTSGHGPIGMGRRFAGEIIGPRIQDLLARMRTSGLDETARNEAGRMFMMTPQQAAPQLTAPIPFSPPGIANNPMLLRKLLQSVVLSQR